MVRKLTRRDALRAGVAIGGGALAGCTIGTISDDAVLSESFESELEEWETNAAIGPEEPLSGFEWNIERYQEQATDGDWSLAIFTEGDHDDGTAWAVTELSPDDADAFGVSLQAWSQSESFNHLRDLVAYLGPQRPSVEESFLGPGENSTGVEGAAFGGLREPLHLAEGWREYTFDWQPEEAPEALFFAVGVSVVWEADATHYVDSIEVTAD